MNTNQASTNRNHLDECRYALCRGVRYWALVFEGQEAVFKHELGALYVAYLLREPPREPLHGVALALKAREKLGQPTGPAEVLEERVMGLEDAVAVRAMWRRQRVLERVLADRLEIETVKAEALGELEQVTEHLRQSPWLSRHGAERSARAVTAAIKRLHARLAAAVDAAGRPDEVLRAFALHLHEYLLVPSGRGSANARARAVFGSVGWFTYEPPRGVVWEVRSPSCAVQSPGSVLSLKSKVLSLESGVNRQPAAVGYLTRFLCVGFTLALLATGCATGRPLRGGKAVMTRGPGGFVEQMLVQGENASQATKQDQESVKVRTYTVPAGSRIEQSQVWEGERPREPRLLRTTAGIRAREDARPSGRQPSTLNSQSSTAFTVSAPMPVVEREEIRTRAELGAAQKDTARELGARLASLKGIVWVGAGLFVFGLASLVWPPLKAVVASATTSGTLMIGGVALMILPTLVVGHELLMLGGVGLAVGAWCLAHRHGQLRGMIAASTAAQAPSSSQGGS
jgi:hypothetical protein